MLQLPHTLVYFGLLSITPCSAFVSTVSVFCIPYIMHFMLSCACILNILLSWYSDDNLVIQRCIGRTQGERSFWRVDVVEQCRFTSGGYSLHWNTDHYKNACGAFQHIYTIRWAGCFNADKLPIDGCSQTTAILLAFIPNRRLEDIESIGIGNIIRRHGSPIGDLSSIKTVIESIHSILDTEHKKSLMKHRVYMVLIGNYSGHMAFATDPPYWVVYSMDYKTNDPSQMTPHHTQNHTYAMVATNMIVRRLLSLPHWEPTDRRQTKGGCLLIPRGMQFGSTLFPEIVILCNHVDPPVDSVSWQEALFQTVGPFWTIDTIFLGFPEGLELFTAEKVVKLKELGVLNPPNAPEHLPLFSPLVFPSQGKVVSAAFGAPPPGFEAHGLEPSLATNRDEESILSDSDSDCHSITVDSSTTWGRPTVRISERESKPWTTECKDRDSHKSSDRDRYKNRERDWDRSKKNDNQCVSEWSHGRSLQCRDHEGQPLPPLPMFHSTPLHALHRLSSDLPDPSSAHLSSNQSWSSLPPLNLGGGNTCPISSASTPIQASAPSVVGPLLPSASALTMNFSDDHIKQIFSLTCEGRHLKYCVVREFIRLSSQEVLFCTQAQSTSHESLASRHPDRFTTYYEILWSEQQSLEAKDKAMEEILNKASEAWLETNAALFKHVLDYEAKLDAFLNKTGGWIKEQEERIWTKMFEITGDAGAPLCASLDIMLRLLDTLPLFPANLSYQSNSPIICSFAPEAYAQPWLGLHDMNLAHLLSSESYRKATDVLKEAIIQSTGGGAVSTARAGPSTSTSTAPTQIKKDADAPLLTSSSAVHSPSKCRCAKSPSLQCSQSDSSSDEESASGRGSKGSHSSSSSSSGSSSESGSGSGSRDGSPARSEASTGTRLARSQTVSIGSIKVLSGDEASGDNDDDVLYSANEADVSQGNMSLLDISVSDNEDTHKCKAHELAHKSDTDSAAWKDKLIINGMMDLQEWDNVVNNYADSRKRRPKNPDYFGTPSLIWRNVEFLSRYPPRWILWGYVIFTPQIQWSYLRLHLWNCRLRRTMSRVSFFSQRHSIGHISLLCSKVAPLLHWDYCRSCICGVHLLIFWSFGLMRPRMGTSLTYPVAHFVRIPSRMIQHTWTTLLACITMQILHVGLASVL